MMRAREAQQRGAATFSRIGKEGANLEEHIDILFGLMRGIHDNQVYLLTALAAIMAQANSRRIATPQIVTPDFARRM